MQISTPLESMIMSFQICVNPGSPFSPVVVKPEQEDSLELVDADQQLTDLEQATANQLEATLVIVSPPAGPVILLVECCLEEEESTQMIQ